MEIDGSNVTSLAVGCSLLGAGGGGDTVVGRLVAMQAIEEFGAVPVVDLDELPDDALVMPCGAVGAPLISIEKIQRGDEISRLIPIVERLRGRPVAALMPVEIGGAGGLEPVAGAARAGLPLVDADGMGRAFPECQQVTMALAGISPNPAVLTDERGNVAILDAIDGHWLERMEREIAVEFGGSAFASDYQMTVAEARAATARGTVSMAIRIGEAVRTAEHDPIDALVEAVSASILIAGKIVDVNRRVIGGFARGSVTIEGLGSDSGRMLRVEIQNENLIAFERDRAIALVPDIITVVDTQTAHAVHTERLRYGQRVTVVAFACDPVWRTDAGLEVAGPAAFGYELEYVPLDVLHD